MDANGKLTDEQLIAAFHGGDGNACEEVLNRYKNKVLVIARRYFLYGNSTEDLVQEGMCGLYSAMMSFKGESGFAPYAYACIRNRIYDLLKRSSGEVPAEVQEQLSVVGERELPVGVTPEDALIDSEESRELSELLKSCLSGLELRAVEMYVDGATMNEMTKALNITYKQLDNALTRAKRKLKNIRKNK